jgi:hypothetical protein
MKSIRSLPHHHSPGTRHKAPMQLFTERYGPLATIRQLAQFTRVVIQAYH